MTSSEPIMFDEYDIVFAGGGTTAGITAGRLAAADPSLRILLLEEGPHTHNDLSHIQPGRFLTHLAPGSKTTRNFVCRPSEHLGGRQLEVQRGNCVGGGSSVNFAMYTRAPGSDYDDWAYKHDNPGWSFADLLPLIKKAETYQNGENRPTHGYDGPLKISYGGIVTNVGRDYMATMEKYDFTRPAVDDPNRMIDDINRRDVWPKWIEGDTGRRSDVAHHYIYNTVEKSSNFHVIAGCIVRKVIIEHGRATGVEYFYNKRIRGAGVDSGPRTVRAKKLVVVSAGAIGSPAILERSGIGARDVLERNGIAQIVDLPGVGDNYNDHWLLFVPFYAKEDSETLDGIVRGDTSQIDKWHAQWLKDGTGLMATNAVDGGFKFRPSPDELREMGPDVAEYWEDLFAPSPDKPILYLGMMSQYSGNAPPPPTQKCYSMIAYMTYPVGTGSVHITSGDDVTADPDFNSGLYSRKEDLATMRYAYKRVREHGRRMSSYQGEIVANHPAFAEGSAARVSAAAGSDLRPAAIDAPDIVYTASDDQAIDEYLRVQTTTAWHSLGTCVMKPRERGGVVDPRLNVYGIEGLKVADLSICPTNVACNTYSTAITVGEKAATIIAEDLGVKGV